MFERFTDQARTVVVLAEEEARLMRHGHIGTEHLLVGLARVDDAVAAPMLRAHGLTGEKARAEVVAIVGVGNAEPGGQIPFTPAAHDALEATLRESLELGHDRVEPAHLLLGVLRQRDGVARRVLAAAGGRPPTGAARGGRAPPGAEEPALVPGRYAPRRADAGHAGRDADRRPRQPARRRRRAAQHPRTRRRRRRLAARARCRRARRAADAGRAVGQPRRDGSATRSRSTTTWWTGMSSSSRSRSTSPDSSQRERACGCVETMTSSAAKRRSSSAAAVSGVSALTQPVASTPC